MRDWLSARLWWVLGAAAILIAMLVATVTMQRARMRSLEALANHAREQARLADQRATAHARNAEALKRANARAQAQLAEIVRQDAAKRAEVRAMRAKINRADTAEEVLDLWEQEYGQPLP